MHPHQPPRPNTHPSELPTSYTDFGQHRFRAPIGIVVDAPIPMNGGWVGIIWPNPDRMPDSPAWSRLCWEPDRAGGRGWLIPECLALADIIEFGSDPTGEHRWYGLVQSYEPGTWLNLQGPYATPTDAHQAAQALFAINCHTPAVMPPTPRHSRHERCRARANRRHR